MTRVAMNDVRFQLDSKAGAGTPIVTAYAFEEPDLATPELIEWIAERAARKAALRQTMVRPFAMLGDSFWSETPDFDPASHIREVDAPTWDDLRALMLRVQRAPFDPSRPMWRIHLARGVTGLPAHPRPCTVVVLSLDHAMADGMGAADLARAVFSAGSPPVEAPGDSTSRVAVTLRALAELPLRPFLLAADVARFARAVWLMRGELRSKAWSFPSGSTTPTALNGIPGPNRVADVVFAPLPLVRKAARTIEGASVNDVVLTAIGTALRRYLERSDVGLVAAVPVSIRNATRGVTRTSIIGGRVDLRSDDDRDFDARVTSVHENVKSEQTRILSPSHLAGARSTPRLPAFVYVAIAKLGRIRPPRIGRTVSTHTTVTTVSKGRSEDWSLAGSPVIANFAVGLVEAPHGSIHTVATIGDVLAVSVTADPDILTDLPRYLDLLRDELNAIADRGARAGAEQPASEPV